MKRRELITLLGAMVAWPGISRQPRLVIGGDAPSGISFPSFWLRLMPRRLAEAQAGAANSFFYTLAQQSTPRARSHRRPQPLGRILPLPSAASCGEKQHCTMELLPQAYGRFTNYKPGERITLGQGAHCAQELAW